MDILDRLRKFSLRPTRQRVALGKILFAKGDRHITAELLHEEALEHEVTVSLATIYNTLNQFTQAGLLREVAVEGSTTYFDTNISDHYHFYAEADGKLTDIPRFSIEMNKLPSPPEGMEITGVDVVVRVRRK